MPTYAYACTSCGHEFDVVQSITDAPLQTCELCGGALRKVFHPVGVTFKGSGFYRTDSRAGAAGSATSTADGKKPAAKSPESGPPSKKDGAPAAASGTKSDGGGSSSPTSTSAASSS